MDQLKRQKTLRWMRPLTIIAILAGLFMIYRKVSYDMRDFYAEFYSPSDLVTTVDDVLPAVAMSRFRAGNYVEAMPAFGLGSYSKNRTKESAAALYSGICTLESGDSWGAITLFEDAKTSQPSFAAQAEWFKIMALVSLGERDKAKEILEYYTRDPDFIFNKEKAARLLDQY